MSPVSPLKASPLKGLRVLVTRPQPHADRLSSFLHQQGAETVVMPMIEIVPLTVDNEKSLLDISLYHKVIAISIPAVDIAFSAGLNNANAATWFTPGLGTAEALHERGVEAFSPQTEFTSEAMLELPDLKMVENEKVLIIKGEGGRDVLATNLRRRGASVTLLPVYQRHCPNYPQGMLDRTVAEEQINAIVATSGQVVSNLLACSEKPQILKKVPVLVPSQRVAESTKAAGFKKVITSPGASDNDIAGALQQLL